jgi:hypothetical protein
MLHRLKELINADLTIAVHVLALSQGTTHGDCGQHEKALVRTCANAAPVDWCQYSSSRPSLR